MVIFHPHSLSVNAILIGSLLLTDLLSLLTILLLTITGEATEVIKDQPKLTGVLWKAASGSCWWLDNIFSKYLPMLSKLRFLVPFLLFLTLWYWGPSGLLAMLPVASMNLASHPIQPTTQTSMGNTENGQTPADTDSQWDSVLTIADFERLTRLEDLMVQLWDQVAGALLRQEEQHTEVFSLYNTLPAELHRHTDRESMGKWIGDMLEERFSHLKGEVENKAKHTQHVSEQVEKEVRSMFYGSDQAAELPQSLLHWVCYQYVSITELQASLIVLERSILCNLTLHIEEGHSPSKETITQTIRQATGETGLTEEDIQLIVNNTLKLYSEDRNGLVDYAMEAGGIGCDQLRLSRVVLEDIEQLLRGVYGLVQQNASSDGGGGSEQSSQEPFGVVVVST
ncbi:SUN domain-containing protein 1-like [Xyrauchen texanus]|uniref:SUN domain-containing protein 1-like n=1 Tax=Xyrauchen texanus TaxID=154827 RepID=UPI002241C59F|nr:SUN domain-containing protein 1-like [Xyrauchen texanus]